MVNTIKKFEELSEKILVKGDFLSTYIRVHFMVEDICKKILKMQPVIYRENLEKLKYFKLISILCDLNCIDSDEKKVLLEVNRIRNQFAHDLSFFPSFLEMKSLLSNCKSTFFEFFEGFSRGLKSLNKVEFIDNSQIEILIDFFIEILYNLKSRYDHIFEESYPDQIA